MREVIATVFVLSVICSGIIQVSHVNQSSVLMFKISFVLQGFVVPERKWLLCVKPTPEEIKDCVDQSAQAHVAFEAKQPQRIYR